ncbi:Wadjet anti-phage system protein JetD domain-containing protein [Cryobacterium psychrophilum]
MPGMTLSRGTVPILVVCWGETWFCRLSVLALARSGCATGPRPRDCVAPKGDTGGPQTQYSLAPKPANTHEATLLDNRELWSIEGKQSVQSLSLLTESEMEAADSLRSDRHGVGVRLEQERIPWASVDAAAAEKLAQPPESSFASAAK